ncbi:MAG TPA: glycerol-3-phosphate dehydrogenase/oxidase [Gemmatimonadota bacterium]|nr:glycerol-3-phosphate dehydrogenase/oxidase [Gemmatimonadota bacterium]
MNRDRMLAAARDGRTWDILVIGGGATGLGTAVDAAARGYDTLLLEAADFAHGTSSRSTKLVHGGVRYLQQGNVGLVLEALRERGRLMRNAPHLVHNQSFVVPVYDWWEGPFYGVGLKLYDVLAGKLGLGPSEWLSREETIERIPTIEPDALRGGVIYYDGQFDDARLAVTLARTAADAGATLINYARVTGLVQRDGRVRGALVRDEESGAAFEVAARVVVNATGAFTDAVRRMDDPGAAGIIRPSQGVHIVLDRSFLPGDSAIMVPHTDDGRVLFAVPWHGRIIVGTTDTPLEEPVLEPRPREDELEFLLTHAVRYLTKDPAREDVLSMFAGIRPLVAMGGEDGDGGGGKGGGGGKASDTASISRDHTLIVSTNGLVTIAGGKWTTYRKMAEDTVDEAADVGGLERRDCLTEELPLRGRLEGVDPGDPLGVYGTDADGVRALSAEGTAGSAAEAAGEPGDLLHPSLPYLRAEVTWAVRHEMARTVDDVLARRTRALLLDARAAIEAADDTARLLAAELGRTADWADGQAADFRATASGYLPGAATPG